MTFKIYYGSIEDLNSQDARGHRDRPYEAPGDIGITHHSKYFEFLVSKMEEIDPEGEISHRIAAKYQS